MHTTLQRICLFFSFILSASYAAASPIDSTAARLMAQKFLKDRTGKLPTCISSKHIKQSETQLQQICSSASTYLFSIPQRGFILTAADTRLPAILGYDLNNGKNISQKQMPEALKQYIKSFDKIVKTHADVTTNPIDNGETIAPLLSFTRHQEAPYNAYCPYYINDDGSISEQRCVVGCVATALEEVMSYHRRAITLADTLHGWSTPHYTIPDILPGTSVDTRLIADNYNDSSTYTAAGADAVAKLSYMLGVASHMNWGTYSSGSSASRPVEALRRAFGWKYVHYADSYKYRPEDWVRMIRGEIRGRRPVFFTGNTMETNGHAFVLDGLDADGLFHVNWGTNGDFDGFFRLDVLYANEPVYDQTPQGGQTGFFTNQQAIFLYPDSVGVSLPDTLQRTGLELVIDSISVELQPEYWKDSPVRLWVHNAASYPTTTTLEFFTNKPTDQHPFEEGCYGALTCVTLQPGEVRELLVYVYFFDGEDRLLRISPDDKHIIYELPVKVLMRGMPELVMADPILSFPEPGTLQVREDITNESSTGRAGQRIYYEVFQGRDYLHGGVVHPLYCFANPGESISHTLQFRNLTPGEEYTLYVRRTWNDICHTITFTVPSPTSLSPLTNDKDSSSSLIFNLKGQRIFKPQHGGIYIDNQGKKSIYK